MSGNLLEGRTGPVTQTIDSGKALAKYLGIKEDLPQVINLANGARLTLSSKRDCYYFTNATGCSCRAGQYNQLCKHRRALQDGAVPAPSRTEAQAYQARQREARVQAKAGRSEHVDSIKPPGKWPGGHNGPFLPDTIKARV
jgi:hypothetical protein